MKLSVIEPNSHGHHYTYVRHIAEAARRLDFDYTIHCDCNSQQSADFENHLGHLPIDRIDPSIQPLGQGRFRIYQKICRLVDRVVKSAKPDIVIYPTADFAAIAVGLGHLAGFRELSGVHSYCMMTKLGFSYPGTHGKTLGWIEQLGLNHSPWDKIGLIDMVAYQRLRSENHPIAERLKPFPDPIYTESQTSKTACRRKLDWDLKQHVFVCPGIQRHGKGIPELIAGYLALPSSLDTVLVFAGPVRKGIRPLFETDPVKDHIRRGRILVIDKTLSTTEMGEIIQAGDATCCVYPMQNHPSSIAITSIAYERPVIYADSLWLREMGARFQLGFPCSAGDPRSVAEAMKASIEDRNDWQPSTQAKKLMRFQSADNFIASWEDTFHRINNPDHVALAMEWEELAR